MKTHLLTIPLAALAALTAAVPAAHAQYSSRRTSGGSSKVYEWQGRVDSEIRLRLRGRRASVDAVGTNERRVASGRFLGEIPRERGTLYVERLEGRGSVMVVQQPTSGNNYTAILRLRDPSGGAANYRIAAYWRSADGTYTRGNGSDRWDNDRGQRGDDRARRDDDRDRRGDDRWDNRERDRRSDDGRPRGRRRDDRDDRDDRRDDDRWDGRRPDNRRP